VTEQYLRTLAEQTPGLNLPAWTGRANDPEFTKRSPATHRRQHGRLHRHGRRFQIGKTGGPVQKLEYSSLTDPAGFGRRRSTS